MINAYHEPLNFEIQERSPSGWRRVIDTGLDSPLDVTDPGQEGLVPSQRYRVLARSVVLLVGRTDTS
jgi:isoamylase